MSARAAHHGYFAAKRLFDLLLGVFLLILALPVLILAAVAIAVTTRSNPLLRQRRVGLRGETFTMLKLRTMREGAWADAPSFSKVPHDPRVTTVGALLRRTSIDELPQLLNVLVGQMSLVGPRPILPVEAATLSPSQRRRFAVRPGLTGLWQVSGRSSLPLERWMALDRLYAGRRSFLLDLAILARTLGAVVSMRGAW
jgi:lipopolysaccharide/colanic/teichoic acid biosynthesis glycosyltransferase